MSESEKTPKRPVGRPPVTPEKEAEIKQKIQEGIRSGKRTTITNVKVVKDYDDVYLPPPPNAKGTTEWKLWAKEAFIELVNAGYTFTDACKKLGVARSWWEMNASRDPEWGNRARGIRSGDESLDRDWPDLTSMTYQEFAEKYLNLKVYDHQAKIVEGLEDPEMNKMMVLGFPESGKSTHVALGYALYRLCRNPDIRIAIVSKMQSRAQDLLNRLKRYLTEEHLYRETERNLIEDFRGFEPARGTFRWDQDQITIRQRRSGERDPSVQALGVGTQIYGARIDLLILDDALTLENQQTEARRDRISAWFLQEAASRAQRGQIIVCGTRVHPFDNYHSWSKAWENDPHFRKVVIPAIVQDEDGKEVSSWPEYWPLDGEVIWDEHNQRDFFQQGLREIRDTVRKVSPQLWRLAYQQEDVQELDAIFSERHVQAALDLGGDRHMESYRPEEIIILGVDPAVSGRAASVVIAYNPTTRIRTVIDVFVTENLGASGIRQQLFYQFWEKYRPQRTVVEVNYAPTLMGDEAFMNRARSYGTQVIPHSTLSRGRKRGSKWDEEYGVAAMAPLMLGGLYAFPSMTPEDRNRLDPLIDDLRAFPYSEIQDAVMALWFAEGEIRYELVDSYGVDEVIQGRQLPPVLARRLTRAAR